MYTQKLLKLNENLGFYFSFHVLTHLTTVFIDIIIMYYYDRLQNRERENGENGAAALSDSSICFIYCEHSLPDFFLCVCNGGFKESCMCTWEYRLGLQYSAHLLY